MEASWVFFSTFLRLPRRSIAKEISWWIATTVRRRRCKILEEKMWLGGYSDIVILRSKSSTYNCMALVRPERLRVKQMLYGLHTRRSLETSRMSPLEYTPPPLPPPDHFIRLLACLWVARVGRASLTRRKRLGRWWRAGFCLCEPTLGS